jgi:hypothetical protein
MYYKYFICLFAILFAPNISLSKEPEKKTLYGKSEYVDRVEKLRLNRIEETNRLHDRKLRVIEKQIFVMNLGLKAPIVSIAPVRKNSNTQLGQISYR